MASMWDSLIPLAAGAAGTAIGGPVGGAIGGALGSAAVNFFGADAANESNAQAIQQIQQGTQQEVGAIQQGQQTLQGIADANAPGQTYLRNVVADAGNLTPAQQLQLKDINRTVTNQIDSSSLAGSGRSAAALIDDASNRFRLGALDANRSLAYGAAGTMAGNANHAVMGEAADSNAIGQAFGQQGNNIAKITQQSGQNTGNAILSSGKTIGTAFGNISSAATRDNNSSYRLGNMNPTAPVPNLDNPFNPN